MGLILSHVIDLPGVTVSNDPLSGDYLIDAEVTITYAFGQPGTFEARLKDLPLDITEALAKALDDAAEGPAGGVEVEIKLGYLDDLGPMTSVLKGRIENLQAAVRGGPLITVLKGHETAAYQLLGTRSLVKGKPPPAFVDASNASPADVFKTILGGAQVPVLGQPTPTDVQLGNIHETASDAFTLLDQVAQRFGAEVLVQDGGAMVGTALTYPPPAGLIPSIPDPTSILAMLTGEDNLLLIDSLISARMADFKPLTVGRQGKAKVITDLPPQSSVNAFDFTVLGAPGMRAGMLVTASVQDYANPFNAFRVLTVTHSYSPQSGYVCTGRAVRFMQGSGNRQLSDQAKGASALSVADRIAVKVKGGAQNDYPSIDVGRIKGAKPNKRVASVEYRQQSTSSVGTPSVDADIANDDAVLIEKPIISPFAWHKVGLSVPVYPGMRAVLAQNRAVREDAMVAGFLWSNTPQMERPKSQAGDWWLCLPTGLQNNLPDGKGANDLVAADGRRVIEAVGLRVIVGTNSLSAVGERPSEGAADVLAIEHSSGTKVTIASNGEVTVETKGQPITLTDGSVTLKVGNGKVAIS